MQRDANGAEYPWPWTRHDRAAPIELLLGIDDAQRPVLHVAGIADAILGNAEVQPTWHIELAEGVSVTFPP